MELSPEHRAAIFQGLAPIVGEEPLEAWLSGRELSPEHRAAIFQGLAPIVGEEAIEALLSERPIGAIDERGGELGD